MINSGMAKKINLFVLLTCIILTVALCPKKKIYYDEPYQVMASNGITNANVGKFTAMGTFTSAALDSENTLRNVFNLSDDSIHYVLLHGITSIFGNDLKNYVAFSLFWAILSLVAFYFLCRDLVGNNIFTALAIIIFFTNFQFLTQAYSIRHYIMGLFFAVLSAIYFFKYYLGGKSAKNMLLLGLYSAIGIISHYFTCYIVLIYVVAILLDEKLAFFSKKNMLALSFPLISLCIYFYYNGSPFHSHDHYQSYIESQNMTVNRNFSPLNEFSLFLKSIAVNFQVFYPLFKDLFIIRVSSALLLLISFLYCLTKTPASTPGRKKIQLAFAMGIISCFFLAFMAVKTHNNMLFSYRYFLFSIPFCCIFITLFFQKLFEDTRFYIALKIVVLLVFISPGLFKFAAIHLKNRNNYDLETNHLQVIDEIKKKDVYKIEVPGTVDAVFINSLRPAGHNITYVVNQKTDTATLYYTNGIEKIRLVQNSLIALY